jgi:hypothetical protein
VVQASPPPADWIEQSKPIAQEFRDQLMRELQKAISAGGTTGAIEVCKTVSAAMEVDFQRRNPRIQRIRRISLKNRNPETHTPTSAEWQWLKVSEQVARSGAQIPPAVLTEQTGITVLFPILIQSETCLLCHGDTSTFEGGLVEALGQHYPQDQATGYQLGDLRGALAIEWKNE